MTHSQHSTDSTQLPAHRPGHDVFQQAVHNITVYREAGKLTLTGAIKGIQVSAYKRAFGARPVVGQLMIWLMEIVNAYAVNIALDHAQVAALANDFMTQYWDLKFAEFAVFTDMAKRGEFGPVYNRLDGPLLHEWMRQYQGVRALEFEKIHHNQKHAAPLTPEAARIVADKLLKPLEAQRRAAEEAKKQQDSDEVRRAKEGAAALKHMLEWFPTEMGHIMAIADERMRRFGRDTTADEILANRKFRKALDQAKKRPDAPLFIKNFKL